MVLDALAALDVDPDLDLADQFAAEGLDAVDTALAALAARQCAGIGRFRDVDNVLTEADLRRWGAGVRGLAAADRPNDRRDG